jgi:hypothetical protein
MARFLLLVSAILQSINLAVRAVPEAPPTAQQRTMASEDAPCLPPKRVDTHV